MKLRQVALIGVVSLAVLGLIGAGAHAVFTTSTTSGQSITAGTWPTTTTPTTSASPTLSITYPVTGTTYGTDWTGAITGTAAVTASEATISKVQVSLQQGSSCWTGSGNTFLASCPNYVGVTSGTANWSLSLPKSDLTSGDTYTVTARATDSAGNLGTSSTVTFSYDTTAPTVDITYPVSGSHYDATSWTGTITGTASSNSGVGTTIKTTLVALEDTKISAWWNGTSFSSTSQTFVPVSGSTTWSLTFVATNLNSSDTYSLVAQTTDSAGNSEISPTVSFTYCNLTTKAPPTVVITYPVNNTTYGVNWTGSIAGTASPNSGPTTTITSSAVAVEDTTIGKWWSGSSFNDGTETFVPATGLNTWYLSFGSENLTSGNNYAVIAEASDSAGNSGTSVTVDFSYEVTPTVTITNPCHCKSCGASTWPGQISGTSSASPGTVIKTVAVAVEDITTKQWWNGTSFGATSRSFVTATGTTTWSVALEVTNLTSNNSYSAVAEATDNEGDVGTSPTVSFTYLSRTTKAPPAVVITYPVNNTTYGANWTGTFTGTAAASAGTNISLTKLSIENTTTKLWWNGSAFTASNQTWDNVVGTTTWYTLPLKLNSNDTYAATAQATDNLGNTGTSATVTFTYATPPPSVTVTYPVNKAVYGTNWAGSITGTASSNSGPNTGIAGVSIAVENTATGKWLVGTSFNGASQSFQTASGTTTWSFGLAAKYLTSTDAYSVIAKATDSVGNTGTSSVVTFTFTSSAPSITITYPAIATTYGTNWGGQITGTASSNSGTETTITTVLVAIENTNTGNWWNGISFSSHNQVFVTANGTTTWSLNLPVRSLSSCGKYLVIAEATDSLNNLGTSSKVTFVFCTKATADAHGSHG